MGSGVLRIRNKSLNFRILKAILYAYALGYVTATGPRLISYLRILRRKDLSNEEKAKYLLHIVCAGLRLNRFPTFCGLLVGGSTILPVLVEDLLSSVWERRNLNPRLAPPQSRTRLIRFLAVLLSAWLCFPILNSRTRYESRPSEITNRRHESEKGSLPTSIGKREPQNPGPPHLAGRTLDLSLFAVTRALDVIACIAWDRWKRHRKSQNRWTRAESITARLADPCVFATSAAIVMWAWFYLPERLPHSYGGWIGEVAQVDPRLIEALRTARRGEWTYGKPAGKYRLLEAMCKDYGWPLEWGDASQTVPIPCEMVHMGCGASCEKHAVWRFAKTFSLLCATYLPFKLLLSWRSPSIAAIFSAARNAIRSSVFLGSFVSLFYYSVCLARTKLGPKLFSQRLITPMMWDSGLCVAAGCMICGWSILVESAKKRQELALFVAPRAAATVLPRRYDKKYQWRENVAFSLSTAVVLTCIQEKPEMVRGVFGRVLGRVLK